MQGSCTHPRDERQFQHNSNTHANRSSNATVGTSKIIGHISNNLERFDVIVDGITIRVLLPEQSATVLGVRDGGGLTLVIFFREDFNCDSLSRRNARYTICIKIQISML